MTFLFASRALANTSVAREQVSWVITRDYFGLRGPKGGEGREERGEEKWHASKVFSEKTGHSQRIVGSLNTNDFWDLASTTFLCRAKDTGKLHRWVGPLVQKLACRFVCKHTYASQWVFFQVNTNERKPCLNWRLVHEYETNLKKRLLKNRTVTGPSSIFSSLISSSLFNQRS